MVYYVTVTHLIKVGKAQSNVETTLATYLLFRLINGRYLNGLT